MHLANRQRLLRDYPYGFVSEPDLEEVRFKLLAGERWNFKPASAQFSILSAPDGVQIERGSGIIAWNPSLTRPGIRNERFIVLIDETPEGTTDSNGVETGCGERSRRKMTEIVLEVHECACENGGECRWNVTANEGNKEAERRLDCVCPREYEGTKAESAVHY